MTMIAPGPCRITHGPCDSFFPNLVGKSVASIRRCLATVFSIPGDAQAFVGGSAIGPEYRLRAGDLLEFLRRRGRKASVPEALPPPEHWDEDETPMRSLLHLEASTYRVDKLFDLPPAKVDCFTENYVVSPGGHFAYRNRTLLGGMPLRLFGKDRAMVVWNGDVVIPMLLDMTVDS
jgi:hypothetical protein